MPVRKTDLWWGRVERRRLEKVLKGCGVTQEVCPVEVMRISQDEGVES